MGKQTFVVRLDENLSRRVGQFLASRLQGYASLDEFIQVALQNQLGIEEGGGVAPESPAVRTTQQSCSAGLLVRPGERPSTLADQSAPSRDTLFVLTNRLGPIKMAARVLAHLGAAGDWPAIEEVQQS